MESLRKGQSKAAFEQFKYAEAILIANQAEKEHTSLLAVTCNNLGCYYKKVGKLHGALSYLRRALKMEVDLGTDEVTIAGTHLNICAILSKLEKHDKAVQHALCALELINQRVSTTPPDQVAQDDYSVLAIAYHNVAVERDYLQQYDKAAAAFEQGHQVAKRFLGEEHPLTLALGKNCEAVLQKTKRVAKPPTGPLSTHRAVMKDVEMFKLTDGLASPRGGVPQLPAVPGASPRPQEAAPMPSRSVRQDAAQWMESESNAWSSFAHSALTGKPVGAYEEETAHTLRLAPAAAEEPRPGVTKTMPLQAIPRPPATDLDIPPLPKEASRELAMSSTAPASWKAGGSTRSPIMQALERHPEGLMDIIDADRTGHPVTNPRQVPHDYRPNRQIKGSTRTARVVRRTGLQNSTKHRDDVIFGANPSAMVLVKQEYMRKMAAERIQRAWRAYYKYCRENHDWMTATWVCATIIQAHWRSYHVRRKNIDRAATHISRHIRGHLVRRSLRKHRAAVSIQRFAVGMITRMQLRKLVVNAVRIQALIRGFVARRRVAKRRAFLTTRVLTLQCGIRAMIAKRRVRELREARRIQQVRLKAAIDIQRVFRGLKGRRRFLEKRAVYLRDVQEYNAASKLQAMARRDAAIKQVDLMRMEKLERMNKAATFVRKMWLGRKTRRKYQELLKEFIAHERHVITMQRIARGFLVRLRMWREAIRMEEELWAALQMQRIWRGYLGRVKYEAKYEEVWRREMAAAKMQQYIRGWIARTKVGRMRRKIARAEFERARLRFRSAQRMQALARGVLLRKRTRKEFARKKQAAIRVQAIWRGYVLRKKLWEQVTHLRATILQAAARGFIVRNRRFHLIAKVICIQRAWRRARRRPVAVKEKASAEMKIRMQNAAKIQKAYKARKQEEEVARIQQQQKS